MDFKKAIVDIFQLVRGAWYLAPMCGGHRFILYFQFSILHFQFSNLTPNVIPCRVLAPGAWNLTVRDTVSFHLTRTAYAENAEMVFKKAIADIFQPMRDA
jgi:hypothetical protein